MNYGLIFLFAAIVIIGAGMLWLIASLTSKKCARKLNVEDYRIKYLSIENQLKRDNPASYQIVVLNADKLVDKALTECGFAGQTMGERMKSATKKFSDLNGIWTAHKLRNQIAHEVGSQISYEETRLALSRYKRALKDLGAI